MRLGGCGIGWLLVVGCWPRSFRWRVGCWLGWAALDLSRVFLWTLRRTESKPVAVDQAKNRVEQLDAQPEQKMQMMSQKEYIYTMETNHDNLRRAWDAGERVQALKIAIQVWRLAFARFFARALIRLHF